MRNSYIIEIRPILEKYKLKQIMRKVRSLSHLKVHRVPHITLIYNFRPLVDPIKIMEVIKEVSNKYSNLEFYYDKYEIKKGKKGYTIALGIRPDNELLQFREDLYKSLKNYIKERSDVKFYNENFWFHAGISFHLSCKVVKNILNNKEILQILSRFLYKAKVLRITLVNAGKIVYEYDVLNKKILNRTEALSLVELERTYKKYRENFLKIEVNPKSLDKIWFISDTHFGHKNIIKYSARPFIEVTTMNEYIKNKWNEMISNDDIIYIIGDFARRDFKKYVNLLNGKKIFIQGNHDPPGIGLKQLELQINNYKFILSHYPINLNSHNAWLIHGHVHNNRLREYPFINFRKKTINVGVDVTKFYPVNLKWILDLIETKIDYLYLPSKII